MNYRKLLFKSEKGVATIELAATMLFWTAIMSGLGQVSLHIIDINRLSRSSGAAAEFLWELDGEGGGISIEEMNQLVNLFADMNGLSESESIGVKFTVYQWETNGEAHVEWSSTGGNVSSGMPGYESFENGAVSIHGYQFDLDFGDKLLISQICRNGIGLRENDPLKCDAQINIKS